MEGFFKITLKPSTTFTTENKNKQFSVDGSEYGSLQSILNQTFVKSQSLDLESLCIRVGSAVFTVECKLSVIEDDGALVDCCSIAIALAVRHFKLPATQVHGEQIFIDKSKSVPLSVHHTPFIVTFASFEDDAMEDLSGIRKIRTKSHIRDQLGTIILDPTGIESKLANGSVVLALNKHRELCSMTTTGGVCLNVEELWRATTVAEKQVKFMHSVIDTALETSGVDEFSFEDNLKQEEGSVDLKDEVMEKEIKTEYEEPTGNVAVAPVVEMDDWGVSDLISGIREDGMET